MDLLFSKICQPYTRWLPLCNLEKSAEWKGCVPICFKYSEIMLKWQGRWRKGQPKLILKKLYEENLIAF